MAAMDEFAHLIAENAGSIAISTGLGPPPEGSIGVCEKACRSRSSTCLDLDYQPAVALQLMLHTICAPRAWLGRSETDG
jgi:hypothetical protein